MESPGRQFLGRMLSVRVVYNEYATYIKTWTVLWAMELNFLNVDNLCASANPIDGGLAIDLSRVSFFRPFSLVYLGMFLRFHTSCGTRCTVTIPNSPVARNYLARQNFWERFNFNPEFIEEERLRRFTSSTSLNDIVDIEKRDYIAEEIADGVMRVLQLNGVRVNIAGIAEIICELVDNFALHSERTLAVFHMQYYPNLKLVIMAIGDCGIGIRASLTSNPEYEYLSHHPHHEAALKALEPLVTRLPQGGTGLTEVKDGIIRLNGDMRLSTGDEYVRITPRGIQYRKMEYDLPGVQIRLAFPVE